MSWHVTTRRQHCAHCRKITTHNVTVYHDAEQREIVYCTECGN